MSCVRAVWMWFREWAPYALPALANGVLVFLGVWLSLPDFADKVANNKTYRYILAGICIALGFIGFVSEVKVRHDSDKSNSQLMADMHTELVNTNSLIASTSSLANLVTAYVPVLAEVKGKTADLDSQLKKAKEKHDPNLVASLESQAKQAREQVDYITQQLREIASSRTPPIDYGSIKLAQEAIEEGQRLKDFGVGYMDRMESGCGKDVTQCNVIRLHCKWDFQRMFRQDVLNLHSQLISALGPAFKTDQGEREIEYIGPSWDGIEYPDASTPRELGKYLLYLGDALQRKNVKAITP
jgi:hypothetical protein